MKDTIYTIPISEVFEPKCGCPICTMRNTLEQRCVEYIMGAAMMEPDIREETNKQGFCSYHFESMLACRNRLSLALMLESHLGYINSEIINKKAPLIGKDDKTKKLEALANSCYICNTIDNAMDKMLDTMLKLWLKEPSFKQLYSEQQYLCLPHYTKIASLAQQKLNKKQLPEFMSVTDKLAGGYLTALNTDVSAFCKMYDYRNAGKNETSPQVLNSIERAIEFLTSRNTAEKKK